MNHVRHLALILPLALTGCGDDRGGGGGGGADAGGGGTDAGETAAMCDNASDRAALDATYPDGSGAERTIQQIARDCAFECLGEPEAEQEACANECIARESDVSAGCASCVTASVGCARDYCITDCLSDPDGMACLACRCGGNPESINCLDVFTACSGVESDDCDALGM